MLLSPVVRLRSEGIDGLRAILALWVLLAHAVPWSVATGQAPTFLSDVAAVLQRSFQPAGETHPAVLAFIVLSGYCIHRNGMRLNTTVDMRRYAVRRFFRIYPVYGLAILAGVVGLAISMDHAPGLAAGLSGTSGITAACVAAKALGIPSLVTMPHGCSFQGNAPLNTVMAEMWLYAAYPVLLIGVGARGGERGIWRVVLAVWVAGIAAMTLDRSLTPWWHNTSFCGFLAYWWIGAKAVDPEDGAPIRRAWRWLLAGWVLLSVPLVLHWADWPAVVELRKMVFAILVAMLISRIDRSRIPLGWLSVLGAAGYSIYAFHAPVVYTLLIYGVPLWATVLAAVCLGLAGYRWVERPCMRVGVVGYSPR